MLGPVFKVSRRAVIYFERLEKVDAAVSQVLHSYARRVPKHLVERCLKQHSQSPAKRLFIMFQASLAYSKALIVDLLIYSSASWIRGV